MELVFKKITEFPRGTLCALLREGYSFEPKFEQDCFGQWRAFDDFFYDTPHIAENCGFMTVLGDIPIGFVSWNPTNMPVSVEIGHNCIAAKYKGKGYGKQQMKEAVKRILAQGAQKIVVTTNEILLPAQRNYESAGFKFVRNSEEPDNAEYAGMRMHYALVVNEFCPY